MDLLSKTLIVVPLYNGEKTVVELIHAVKRQGFTRIVVCDDASSDRGAEFLEQHHPDVQLFRHATNRGYGANQKTLYSHAVQQDAAFVIMLHGDGQYTPELCTPMAAMLNTGIYDVVIASRIITSGAMKNGMPVYKYIANRSLTLFQNIATGRKLSEYHTGYRAYRTDVLSKIDFKAMDDDFIFDNQMLLAIIGQRFEIGEISCPTLYSDETSSISFKRSVKYGLGVVCETLRFIWINR